MVGSSFIVQPHWFATRVARDRYGLSSVNLHLDSLTDDLGRVAESNECTAC